MERIDVKSRILDHRIAEKRPLAEFRRELHEANREAEKKHQT